MYAEGGEEDHLERDWRGDLEVASALEVLSEKRIGDEGVMGKGEVLDFLALDAHLIRCWLRLGSHSLRGNFSICLFRFICNFSIIPRHQYDLLCLL